MCIRDRCSYGHKNGTQLRQSFCRIRRTPIFQSVRRPQTWFLRSLHWRLHRRNFVQQRGTQSFYYFSQFFLSSSKIYLVNAKLVLSSKTLTKYRALSDLLRSLIVSRVYLGKCHLLHNLHIIMQTAIHWRNRKTTRRSILRTPTRRWERWQRRIETSRAAF